MNKILANLKSYLLQKSYYEPCVVISADREVLIENIRRVNYVNEISVNVTTYLGDITVWGEELSTRHYKDSSITILGRINSCELEWRKNNAE